MYMYLISSAFIAKMPSTHGQNDATPSKPRQVGEVLQKQLLWDASRLFRKSGANAVDFDVININEHGAEPSTLRSETAVREYLGDGPVSTSKTATALEAQDDIKTARYYLLEPSYGWSELPLTLEAALDLLSSIPASPFLCRQITAFGRRDTDYCQDEGFSAFDFIETLDEQGNLKTLELSYLLKYVGQREGVSAGANPYSIRHVVMYQRLDFETGHSDHVLVRLSEPMKDRLGDEVLDNTQRAHDFVRNWYGLHSIFLGTVEQDMRKFVNYLDSELTMIFDHMQLSGIEPEKLNEYDTAHRSAVDMKTLQYLQDQAQRLSTVISLNLEMLESLANLAVRLGKLFPKTVDPEGTLTQFFGELERFKREHRFSLISATAVINRARSVGEQLRDTISLRNTELANNNTAGMVELSRASSRETQVLKTLTVLALIFVPASYVADFLQMGFVTLSSDGSGSWTADPGLQIYAALAFPLITATMAIYGLVEWTNRRRKPSLGDGFGSEKNV
ncbi:hypothetical protein B0T24DRAFT_632148 [Lasiosphaeria ovina]|uniref:CorA-like transporter domain-containing protein n=1 Tax=Lasiosphaeria ovina TaxID=92902 RepID=A0AAE0N4J9_9PEZI|nr:hypothetical protein B0T24DRAFT_632148 [Lasiosphaeria ovina]